MKKHLMVMGNSSPLSEISICSPNPNPNSEKNNNKGGHHRKQKQHPSPCSVKEKEKEKENSDPVNHIENIAGKPCPSPSPLASNRSPLPPRPPGNPLKRKLTINDHILPPPPSPCLDSEVRVVVRIRPFNKDEQDSEIILEKVSNHSLSVNAQTFTFDSVADTQSTQLDIFHLLGAPLVENCIAGFNSSVFAYGQTGSGKTYTMWGPPTALFEQNLANDQQGLTPRVFHHLFARINQEQLKHADKQLNYQCRCSFLEIYNEQITDLLDPSHKNLQIREDVKSGVYVENLTEECVSNLRDVIQLLLKGLSNRRTGATSINAESSRSHSVFTCVVESHCKSTSDGLSSFKTSRINLVDLAGSERQKSTGAAGERLKEAGNINRSLSQLGNLINILAEISQTGKQRHIPYRDSRLTFLLQESLGGNAKLAMICAISPAQSCKSETFSTLRFAQRAKAIKNKAVVNEVMQDDVNFLREVIRQLKDELLRMKAHGNHTDPNAAYANSWNARRSLNLLKLSLNQPMVMSRLDDDGDEEMEIDEEAAEKLLIQVGLQSTGTTLAQHDDGTIVKDSEGSDPLTNGSENAHIEKQDSEVSDVSMEEGISEIDHKFNTVIDDGQTPNSKSNDMREEIVNKAIEDGSANAVAVSPSLSIVPCEVSPNLQSPAPSVSPRLVTSSRKSLKTSSMLTASQKDAQSCELGKQDANASSTKCAQKSSKLALTNNIRLSTNEDLAASLHRGLEILDQHRQSSAFRKSTFRFSFKPTDLKPLLPVEKVDVGIQTLEESNELHEEDGMIYLCSNCKNGTLQGDLSEANETSNLQLVPVDKSLSAEKPRKQVPKAVEKVLAGAIRREMALEDFCAKQTSEIAQLTRLVQQYKHERECNGIISQLREDKIIRLESLMDGVLPSEDFMEEELVSLHKEHELLKEKYDHHPDMLLTKIEFKRAQDELERYRNFFDMGERDVLLEEIYDLKSQLQYYADHSQTTRQRKSLLQLTYPCDSSSTPSLNTIPESTEEIAALEKLERERIHWTEVESQWISLAEELKIELEESRVEAEQLKQELEAEKKCSDELKEAMQLAMQGHARMLEQYADLEEKHMQMLARQRKMQEGIGDVKKAAAKAGVKGAESKFINALASEISALKVQREKERQYWRDENKMLQAQLRDTAEAVQAAGELLIRLKEAEEAVASAENRAAQAEEKTANSHTQIENLKKKHEMEISTLNQMIAETRLPKEAIQDPYHESDTAKYDAEDCHSAGDESWKEEFKTFYDNGGDDDLSSKFAEPSSWFSGYDRCNI